jgi:hypothetical protein
MSALVYTCAQPPRTNGRFWPAAAPKPRVRRGRGRAAEATVHCHGPIGTKLPEIVRSLLGRPAGIIGASARCS